MSGWKWGDSLQDRGVHNVHQQHRLEEGVSELRLGLKKLPCLVRLGGDECLRLALVFRGGIAVSADPHRYRGSGGRER